MGNVETTPSPSNVTATVWSRLLQRGYTLHDLARQPWEDWFGVPVWFSAQQIQESLPNGSDRQTQGEGDANE